MRRHVLTSAPESGKTTLMRALRKRGHAVVEEAATDVIARQQALGLDEPWHGDDFLYLIVAVQRRRQTTPVPETVQMQIYDRSPLRTLALARYLGRRITPALAEEVARVLREQLYEPAVFLARPIRFVEPTTARRRFARVRGRAGGRLP